MEWHDEMGLFGGNHFIPHNPAGFRRFIDMVRKHGMKLLVYVSTSLFTCTDPDFRKEWSRGKGELSFCWNLAECSYASPGWRAYFFPHLVGLLDDYGVDGVFNDAGYQSYKEPKPPWSDDVVAFGSEECGGHTDDMRALIYAEVNRRGGIVKLHMGNEQEPKSNSKIHDYLWVGEGATNADHLRQMVKNRPPYVVPCLDFVCRPAKIENEDELYLNTIPYMQFPLLLGGRPFTGERGFVPGIKYGEYGRNVLEVWEHYKAHPEGPHPYGWWDSVPGRPEARPTWAGEKSLMSGKN